MPPQPVVHPGRAGIEPVLRRLAAQPARPCRAAGHPGDWGKQLATMLVGVALETLSTG